MNKTISLIFGALTVFFAACEPIEKRDVLTNSFNPDDIKLEVIQSTAGGNELSIQMNTPGVTGYWDYIIDKKSSDRVEVIFPIRGKSTFTFYVTTPYLQNNDINAVSYISKTVDVTINQLDHALPEANYKLVGANLEGKTWVFDGAGHDGKSFWYMTDAGNWQSQWWNAGDCCPPADVAGKMVFDFAGKANFTYYASPTAAPVTGSTWAFNPDYTKLIIKGSANILGAERAGETRVFEIKEFTADRMVLFLSAAVGGTGWVWIFKPAV